MSRAYTRESTRPDVESEQTHDDCEWLNEEDGEQNVFGNGAGPRGCGRPPPVAQYEGRDGDGYDDPMAQDRAGEAGGERGT